MSKQMNNKTFKKRIKIACAIYGMLLLFSLVAERFITINAVAGIDGRMFFYACFGFIICVIFIIFSKLLGFFIKRHEDYYKESRND